MKVRGLAKPEYVLKPRNILSRIRNRSVKKGVMRTVRLFESDFCLNPNDVIGRQILHFGVFDLLVTEALVRLADPGETAIDVGANIGYMSCVLAKCVTSSGIVMAFEPHPALFKAMKENIAGRSVEPMQFAVSDNKGTAELHIPVAFEGNCGIASLEPLGGESEIVEVGCVSLDSVVPPGASIGVLKIDIEGHELTALRGAQGLLKGGRIRDIVFEEHNTRSSSVVSYLQEQGYKVFRLHKRFFGPALIDPDFEIEESTWESPSFLATIHPQRALARFQKNGWKCL